MAINLARRRQEPVVSVTENVAALDVSIAKVIFKMEILWLRRLVLKIRPWPETSGSSFCLTHRTMALVSLFGEVYMSLYQVARSMKSS